MPLCYEAEGFHRVSDVKCPIKLTVKNYVKVCIWKHRPIPEHFVICDTPACRDRRVMLSLGPPAMYGYSGLSPADAEVDVCSVQRCCPPLQTRDSASVRILGNTINTAEMKLSLSGI
jgi:hypothetical protein